MKKIFNIALAALFLVNVAHAGVFGDQPSYEIFGRNLTGNNLKNFKVLLGAVDTAGRYTSFWQSNGAENYQVPSGYQLRIFALRSKTGNASTGLTGAVGYGSNATGINTTTAPNDIVYMYDAIGTAVTSEEGYTYPTALNSTLVNTAYIPVNFVVPALSYPFIKSTSGASQGLYAYGYLEIETSSIP